MSSMRNTVQRRSHRERAQPVERQRFGLLEKHKDYSLRAKDYNKKKAQIKSLRQKAAERNEDEFYFGMLSRNSMGSRLKDGRKWSGAVAGDRGNKAMDMETVRLLKTQDVGYVRTMRNVISKEVKRLEEQVVLVGGIEAASQNDDEGNDSDDDDAIDTRPAAPRKIVFLDGTEAKAKAAQQEAMDLDGDGSDEDEFKGFDDDKEDNGKDDAQTQKEKTLQRLRLQLQNAKKKLKVLAKAEEGLEIQRAKMAKTATSGGTTKKGKKIMVRTRKR
ncbi:putative U3 small nucleolar RNA-associated protein 11 [Colletotrichum tanaceti]|uniref:Putative U3 small nucleolar RNA-associated protein 11 n=1 Tax=Colletotrichum tanaceti TaxID=1306861 RepID=A0A4U6XUD8_9PEZI|nr:putative U3 small nucleolar RNA-associated protein 11 [Colletotrichum tanaceti]TKW59542.1 putative U3 small nucleolar RNA-associated protein 11 [Colletotrichum tanaceti]